MKLAEFLANYIEREFSGFIKAGFKGDTFDYEKVIQAGLEAFVSAEETTITIRDFNAFKDREYYTYPA